MDRDYSKASYWEQRYAQRETTFDWYFDWPEFEQQFLPKISIEPPILMVGCGNSELSNDLEKHSISPVVSIDISRSVVEQMSKKFGGCYLPMNACNLQLRDGIFPCVIDKGTLDALLCCAHFEESVAKMINEIVRVLAPNGIFVEITFGTAEERRFLDCPDFLPWHLEKEITIQCEAGKTNAFVFRKFKEVVFEAIPANRWHFNSDDSEESEEEAKIL